MEVSVIIPVYNASASIATVVEKVQEMFVQFPMSHEIILVDDGSTDDSWSILKTLKAKSEQTIKIIRLARNFGQHNATLCGFSHAKGELVVTIDDDLEMDPLDIPKLIQHQKETNADLVYGEFDKHKGSVFRKGMKRAHLGVSKLEGKGKGRGSSFRVISRRLTEKILHGSRFFTFIDEVVSWYTDKVQYVAVKRGTSLKSQSGYSLFRLSFMFADLVMFSSLLPLRLVTLFGLLLAGINFPLGIYFILKKLFFKAQLGYTSVIVSILFGTGIILLFLGIIAGYMSNMIRAQNGKPIYFEDEVQ